MSALESLFFDGIIKVGGKILTVLDIDNYYDPKTGCEAYNLTCRKISNSSDIKKAFNRVFGIESVKSKSCIPAIVNVIFNDPATIVFWEDGTKTVVKCGKGDKFDPEKGLAMAISKYALGNHGNYFETIKKWTKNA